MATALPQKAEVKSRLQAMLGRCDNIVATFMARRVNIAEAYKFFVLLEEV